MAKKSIFFILKSSGVAWYQSSKIEGFRYVKRDLIKDPSGSPIWARFYEIETNRPFFCDRDGVKKYRLEEISSGRQNAYAWYNYAGDKVAKAYDIWPHR